MIVFGSKHHFVSFARNVVKNERSKMMQQAKRVSMLSIFIPSRSQQKQTIVCYVERGEPERGKGYNPFPSRGTPFLYSNIN